ncbi:hypothetical protein Vadar_020215 [Vaccinium darrowii]|uniref:Uncharacterized protein n=1 Tax=Vaccinium darrowii TaxID=229202 RepID=A0ACB7YQC3_9ERIC|nr:hypothetical protein Vadar_020215 [Vaccinium darrowii]
MCNAKNMTDLTRYYGYKKAFETAFKTLIDLQEFNRTIIMRTISPTHFEPEYWEGRGNCVRRKPFTKQDVNRSTKLQRCSGGVFYAFPSPSLCLLLLRMAAVEEVAVEEAAAMEEYGGGGSGYGVPIGNGGGYGVPIVTVAIEF